MSVSRRQFLKASAATAAYATGLTLFSATAVFGDDTVLIPHASHYGPFKAVVKMKGSLGFGR
jgi:trimethylamine-N-oxide reductase (cytochrome c)